MIINRETGNPPTKEEMKAIQRRAFQILQSPYSSPEQIAWAIDMYPEGLAMVGPLEPIQETTIFNRRQADGTFRPLSEFFDR